MFGLNKRTKNNSKGASNPAGKKIGGGAKQKLAGKKSSTVPDLICKVNPLPENLKIILPKLKLDFTKEFRRWLSSSRLRARDDKQRANCLITWYW